MHKDRVVINNAKKRIIKIKLMLEAGLTPEKKQVSAGSSTRCKLYREKAATVRKEVVHPVRS